MAHGPAGSEFRTQLAAGAIPSAMKLYHSDVLCGVHGACVDCVAVGCVAVVCCACVAAQ